MLHRYRAAFEPRGSLSFSLAGLLGRLPSSMVGLGLVLVVSAHGDYGTAGTLVGIQALSFCVGGPLQGRLADRFGQARTLVPTSLAFGVALAGLILGLRAGSGFLLLAVLAGVVGFVSPTTGTLARSRWNGLHPAGGRLQTAFAVEAVFDEVVFVTGPVATTLIATHTDPLLALVVAGVAGVIGGLLLAAQRRTEPVAETSAVSVADGGTARRRLPLGALAPLLLVQLTIGMIFGSTDVVTVADASLHGERALAGLILACFSGGSLLAGLVVGAIRWRMDPMRRVRICVAVLGCTTLLLPLVPGLTLLPLAGFAVGMTVSPALVAIAAAVQAVTPRERLTEAMAIGTSFLVGGFSLGSALAGHLVDAVGPRRAFGQAAASGLFAAACVVVPPLLARLARLSRLGGQGGLSRLGDRTRFAGRPATGRTVSEQPASGAEYTSGSPSGPTASSTADPVVTNGAALVSAADAPGTAPVIAAHTADTANTADTNASAAAGATPTAGRVLRSSARVGRAMLRVRPRRGAAPQRTDQHRPGARRTGDSARRH